MSRPNGPAGSRRKRGGKILKRSVADWSLYTGSGEYLLWHQEAINEMEGACQFLNFVKNAKTFRGKSILVSVS